MERTDTLRNLLVEAAERATGYVQSLGSRPVAAAPAAVEELESALKGALPDSGRPAAGILRDLDRLGSPATIANAGGRYFGFVTGGALPAAQAANILAGAWDQNAFSRISSPAAAVFGDTVSRWTLEALGLPAESAVALVTGATMAHFTCLAAARSHVLNQAGWNVDADGLFGAPEITVVVGDEAHASLFKVLGMLGFGRDRVLRLPVDAEGAIRADNLPDLDGPAILCLQAGNVNSGAFDPAEPLIAWAHKAGAWVHVDGAFGIWALASPELAGLARRYELADSWALDAHKWLNVPYDSGIAVVRDPAPLARAMASRAAYLMAEDGLDAIDLSPEGSRRARAIEIFAALSALGRDGLAELIERNCRQARMMAEGLVAGGAEVLNDVVLNQVVVAFGDRQLTEATIARVQADGTCWCGGTVWKGRSAMRISVSSWATTDQDIARSRDAILAAWRAADTAPPG